MLTITAKTRDTKEDLEALRTAGDIPAVFYGAGNESTPISISNKEFKKIWSEAGESSTIDLKVGQKEIKTLIYDVQLNPVNDEPIHVDFLAIDVNKKISVAVPLIFEGTAPAVKNGLGSLVKVLHEVEVEALPADLPHDIKVDLSSLIDLESSVSIKDLPVGANVEILADAEDTVASIVAVKEEEEEAPAEVDLSAIEVEKKGKEEEEAPAEGGESSE